MNFGNLTTTLHSRRNDRTRARRVRSRGCRNQKNDLGAAAQGIESLRVTLHESHVASAGFEGPVTKAAKPPLNVA
jgi:hypothetical protein